MHTKYEQKMLGNNEFFAPVIFKNPLKNGLSIRKIKSSICIGRIWIVISKTDFYETTKVYWYTKHIIYRRKHTAS